MRLLVIDCGWQSAGEKERGERERERACVCGTLFLETCAHCHFEQCSSHSRWGNLSRSRSLFRFLSLSFSLASAKNSPGIRCGLGLCQRGCSELVLGWVWVGSRFRERVRERRRESLVSASQSITQFDFAINSCLFEWTHGPTHACPPFFASSSSSSSTGLWLRRLEIAGDSIGLQKQLSA